jgi:hypothetical protein
MGKSMLGSKLTWVGVITALVSMAQAVQGSEIIAAYPQAVAWVGVAVGVGTALLRVFGTSKPIASVLPKK